MSDYRTRMKRVHELLMDVADRFRKRGYTVYTIRTKKIISRIRIERDARFVEVGFDKISSKWYVGQGFYRLMKDLKEDLCECPFAEEEIIDEMVIFMEKSFLWKEMKG